MAQQKNTDTMKQVEDMFMKLPPLPKSAKDLIVSITPWLSLIFGLIGVLGLISALGVFTGFAPMMMWGYAGRSGFDMISIVISLIGSVLLLASFPGTKAQKLSGWKLLFYSEVVSTVASLIAFNLGSIVVALIAFYLLFQIKSYYK